jgi:hypothetical protein
MAAQEKEVLLMIADISGYTRFVTSNSGALVHAQIVITELLRAVMREARLPFQVAKLEGDAVFFYLEKRGNEALLKRMGDNLCLRLDRLFAAFHRKIAELVQSNTCPCGSCRNIENLQLKMVVHSGVALFYQLDKFMEMSGPDVILVHRLLKNSVPLHEYVLLTETANRDLELPEGRKIEEGEETYDDLGRIQTYLYVPAPPSETSPPAYNDWFHRTKTRLIKQWGEIALRNGWLRLPGFRNLSA